VKSNWKSKDGRFVGEIGMPSAAAIAVAMAHGVKGPDPVVLRIKSVPKKQRNSGARNE
jgi:hypothetical protein